MEAAGLAVGAVALAGLFNNTVDCFEYIQVGRSFGKNFQTSVLKLDVARLRLSRWGESIGLSSDLDQIQSLDNTKLAAEEVRQSQDLLGQIQDLFADAEGVSKKFESRTPPGKDLILHNLATDLDPVPTSLHQKMRELSIKRQSHAKLRRKAKWALYEEKHFKRLIEDVTDLVNSLVTLFPAAEIIQQRLCEIEVSEIGNAEGSLPMLKEAAADQDHYLSAAISNAVKQSSGQSYNVVFSGANNSGFQMGHNSGSIGDLRWG